MAELRKVVEAVKPEPTAEPESESEPVAAPAPAPEPEKPRSAVEEYEATLEGGADDRRRNERIKVWAFIGVFAVLLAIVVYFYFTAQPEAVESDADEIETVEEDAAVRTDSIIDSVATAPVVPVATPAPKVAAKPAVKPAAAAPAEETEREITVKSLSEQTGNTTADQPSE